MPTQVIVEYADRQNRTKYKKIKDDSKTATKPPKEIAREWTSKKGVKYKNSCRQMI